MRASSTFRNFIFSLIAAYAILSSNAAQAQTTSDGFEYTVSNNTVTITGYMGSGGAVTIPSTINGLPVTSIGQGAFQVASLTSVTIPNSVISIGISAFYFCTSLTSVTIGNSVISIGVNAFQYCPSLTSVVIGNSVTSIGISAFSQDRSLTNVTIPDSVTSVGNQAFDGCSSLSSVIIGKSVTNIGSSAFLECFNLTSITVPASVTSIGIDAFADCTSLTEITVDSNNPAFISVAGVLFDQSQTTLIQYPVGSAGTSYIIPASVTSIADRAFQGCRLTSVTIPASVTNIADFVFTPCGSLTTINVDPNNTAFSSVAGVLFNQNQTVLIQYPMGKIGTSYAIPNSVTSIASNAFADSRLTNITIPNSVTSIGNSAFFYCTNLNNVTIPNSVASLGVKAFYNTSIANVTIPNSVTSIGDNAFGACLNLNSVYFTGNAPTADSTVFDPDNEATVYYLPDTTGWGSTFAGASTVTMVQPAIITPPTAAALVARANAILTVTASGEPAPAIQWQVSTDGGNTWSNVSGTEYNGTTTATLTITAPATTMLGYQYQAVITNLAGTATTTPVPLVVGTSSAQLTWLQNNFTSTQLGNPAIVGDLATPANDGIPNLIKYAFNLNPFVDGNAMLPTPQVNDGQLTLTFPAPPADLAYSVQASTDLINWSTTGVTTLTSNGQVTASYTLSGNTPAFMQIVISPAP